MKKYDLIVVGGGLSGVASAVSAAREGLKVLLVERSGCLGGAMSNNLVYPFVFFYAFDEKAKKRIYFSEGIFTEMREKAAEYEQPASDMHFKPEGFKVALDKMVQDAGVDVLFHTTMIGVEIDGNKIKSVKVALKNGITDIKADYFIDASGDGDLFYFAGCEYVLGRENDGLCQPMTTCFRLSGVDLDLYQKDLPMLQKRYKELRESGNIKNPRENILTMMGLGQGILHLNTTRVIKLNPTDPFELSKAEMTGRAQVFEMVRFLKENSKAFEQCTVISIANEIGVRESRKLKGMHVLTAEELVKCTNFEDAIARGNYNIDIHNPSGTGTYIYYFKNGESYTIPYRSLVAKEYVNLLVAGRCISATHEAQAAIRVMPICACMGQAAGTAIAVAVKSGADTHTVSIEKVREILKKNNANI